MIHFSYESPRVHGDRRGPHQSGRLGSEGLAPCVPDTSTVTALTFGGTPSQRITGRDPLLGALGSVSLGGHTVTFGYDHQLGVRTSTTYVPPTRTTDGSVRADSYAPFTALPVETSFNVAQVDSVLHRAYGYDSAGRLTSEQVAINYFKDGDGARQRQRQFSYDSLGRLTSVTVRRGTCMPWPSDSTASDSLSSSFGWRYTCGTVAPDSGAVFSYDSVGNRTDHSAVITAGDRLASFNGDTITYDDDGNLIRRYNPVAGADHRYVWNALGQLDSAIVVSAIDPQSGQRTTVAEHYVYDASGRLVHVDGSPNTGWLVYHGDQVSEVVQSQSAYTDVAYDDGTDRPAMEYIHTLPSDEWRAEVIDPMGNLAGTVNLDSIGVPHTWDAWGRNTSTMWDAMDALGWKGLQPETGTGLIYMRARWYDPTLGRFISEDPAGLAGGINPYVFADDDPINNSDPSGMIVDDDPVCVHFSTGKWMCSYSPVNITAPATSPFSNPNTWIDSREPADVPSSSLTFTLQGLHIGSGSNASAARKSSDFNWKKCLSAGASLGLAGLNTFSWFTGGGEAAFAVKGGAALTRAVARSIALRGAEDAENTGKLALTGFETALTEHAFGEKFDTEAKIKAVAELFPVLDVISTGISAAEACH